MLEDKANSQLSIENQNQAKPNPITKKEESLEVLTKKVAKGGGIVFIATVIGRGINFVLQLLLARVLGVSFYGLYALGLSIVEISHHFSTIGLGHSVVRYGSLYKGVEDKSRIKGTFVSAFAISLISSIFLSTIIWILAENIAVGIFKKPGLLVAIRIFSISIPFYTIIFICAGCFRSFQLAHYDAGLTNVFRPLANIIFVSIAFILGFRFYGAVYGFLGSTILAAIVGFYYLRKVFYDVFSEKQTIIEIKKLLRFALPTFFVGLSTLILFQTDKVMLGYFKMAKDVGIYKAASLVANQSGIFAVAFYAIFSPMISDLYNRKKMDELNRLLKIVTRWLFTLTLPTSLILILFSKNIMSLFGGEFISGWMVLIALSSAFLLSAGIHAIGYVLLMSGKQDVVFLNSTFLIVMNISLNLWLIRIYGAIGAAIATGLSLVIFNFLSLILTYKLLGLWPFNRIFYKPIIAGLTMVLFYYIFIRFYELTSMVWILNLLGVCLIYLLTIIILKIEEEDKSILLSIRKRIFSI